MKREHVFGVSVKTDNSYLEAKKVIRSQSIEGIENPKILECFAGESSLWGIKTTRIDQRPGLGGIYLRGDNRKFLMGMDLTRFNVIDLDAYGMPIDQLEIVFKKKYKGIVHVTFIQTMMGNISHKLLMKLGYTKKMIEKCPTLFSTNGIEKLLNYLSLNSVKKVYICSYDRKHYLYFKIG